MFYAEQVRREKYALDESGKSEALFCLKYGLARGGFLTANQLFGTSPSSSATSWCITPMFGCGDFRFRDGVGMALFYGDFFRAGLEKRRRVDGEFCRAIHTQRNPARYMPMFVTIRNR